MRQITLIPVIVVTLCMLLFSCKKETHVIYKNPVADSAYLSITNASPVVSDLFFYDNNQFMHLPDSPLSFGNTTFANYVINSGNDINPITQQLPYIKVPAGYVELGFKSSSPNASFFANNYFEPGSNYSVFITDSINHGQFQFVMLNDKTIPTDTTQGQIRFLNLSPDAPPLDVYAFPDAGANGTKIFSGCAYLPNNYNSLLNGQTFTAINAGPYYFVATISGTNNALLEGGLIISAKSVVTIYAKGFVAGTGTNAIDVGVILYQQQ